MNSKQRRTERRLHKYIKFKAACIDKAREKRGEPKREPVQITYVEKGVSIRESL